MSEYKRKTVNGIRVSEHVLVAEKMIGRKLLPNEIVHHKNRIKKDNRELNLEVMTKAEHCKHHSVDRTLISRGIKKCDYHLNVNKYSSYKYCKDCLNLK